MYWDQMMKMEVMQISVNKLSIFSQVLQWQHCCLVAGENKNSKRSKDEWCAERLHRQ